MTADNKGMDIWSLEGSTLVGPNMRREFASVELAQEYQRKLERAMVTVAAELADAPSGANAPYKIQKRGDKFVVVNNAGLVKATFKTMEAARQYQKALYANVPGAAKRADKTKFTGKARNRVPEKAAHDLVFFEKRSTPLVVSKGAPPSSNSNYTEKYGKQTSRRAATADEESQIAKGKWVQVDSKGNKSGDPGYKQTQYRPGLVKKKD